MNNFYFWYSYILLFWQKYLISNSFCCVSNIWFPIFTIYWISNSCIWDFRKMMSCLLMFIFFQARLKGCISWNLFEWCYSFTSSQINEHQWTETWVSNWRKGEFTGIIWKQKLFIIIFGNPSLEFRYMHYI